MNIIRREFSQIERKLSQLFVIIIVIISASVHSAYAEFAAITVSPVTRTLGLSFGEKSSGIFTVFNDSDETRHVNIEPRYWHMLEENKAIPLDSWLEIVPSEFDIGPREKKEVTFNVTVPEKAVGELAAMIAFKPAPKEGQAVNVVFSVSLYVTIKGTEKIDCKVSDFKMWKLEDKDALGIKCLLKNDGNIHLKPFITVYIQNIFNKILNKTNLIYGTPTYPGKIQDYHGTIYEFKLKPGIYKAMIDAEFTDRIERLRRYVYFLAGKNGKILFVFFRRERR